MRRALLGIMPQSMELKRGIVVGKRRYAGAAWACAGLVGGVQIALFALAAMPRHDVARPPAPLRAEPAPAPAATTTVIQIPLPVPLAAPIVVGDAPARACPPEVATAPRVAPPELPEEIAKISPAPSNARWIAAWNDKHVYVSTDAGATFARVLDGPGDVRGVAFDCFGHAAALRGDHLGVLDGTRESWRAVPGLALAPYAYGESAAQIDPFATVIGGGPDVLVVGVAPDVEPGDPWRGTLALTSDLGATWSYRELGGNYEQDHVRGRQLANGDLSIAISTADCRGDDLRWTTRRGGAWAIDTSGGLAENGSFGVYGDLAITDSEWKREGGASWKPIRGEPAEAPTLIPGPFPVLVSGGEAYRLVDGAAHALPWKLRGELQAVDRAGRLWTVDGGQPRVLR